MPTTVGLGLSLSAGIPTGNWWGWYMTTHWARRALLVTVLGSLLFGASLARVGSASAAVTRADVFKALNVDQVPADYVVVVDTSSSMQGSKYDRLLDALDSFVGALSPNDHLSLITFDSVPALRYSGKVGNDPQKVIRQLPATPEGTRTDMGAAFESAITELQRPGASDIETLAFFTDGNHRPPDGSLYPLKTGAAWTELRTQADALGVNDLGVYAIALRRNSGSTDVGLLKQVFPHTQVLGLSPDQLPDYLDRIKEQTRTAKAKSLLRTDVDKGVEVKWPAMTGLDLNAGSADVQITVRSLSKHLPFEVNGLKAAAEGFGVAVSGMPKSLSLAPGETKKLPVKLTWTWKKPFRFLKAEATEASTLSLNGALTSQWVSVLKDDLNLKLAAVMPPNSGAFSATGEYGMSLALIVGGLVLIAVVVAAAVYKWRTRNEKMGGVFRIQPRAGSEQSCEVHLSQRRQVAFGGRSKDGAGWPGSGTLIARTEKKSKPSPRGKPVKRNIRFLVVNVTPPEGRKDTFTIEMGETVERSGRRYRWSTG